MSLTLPRWLYDGIVEKEMDVTIYEDYLSITGSIEHWLYRVARKHAGNQTTGRPFTMHMISKPLMVARATFIMSAR